jgi:hypothetical protein
MFPGTASQERLPKQNLEEQLQASLQARTGSQARFLSKNPKLGFQAQFRKQCFE